MTQPDSAPQPLPDFPGVLVSIALSDRLLTTEISTFNDLDSLMQAYGPLRALDPVARMTIVGRFPSRRQLAAQATSQGSVFQDSARAE